MIPGQFTVTFIKGYTVKKRNFIKELTRAAEKYTLFFFSAALGLGHNSVSFYPNLINFICP